MTELKDELLLYPRGKHDDLLDGMYYAMKKSYRPHHTKIQSITKEQEVDADDISWKIA